MVKKKSKPVSKKIWTFSEYLPRFIRKNLIRSQYEMCYDLSPFYTFKQAETESEILDALQIVYDAYLKLGYIDEKQEKIHFNKYLCLPTTIILIIKHHEEVIGTMSIILDSHLGFPTETSWDLSELKSDGKKYAEISSLAIKKEHKNNKGHVLLTLCKFMIEYCYRILKLDGIVIATTHEVEPFYTDIFLFKKLVNSSYVDHKLVKGNRSVCCYLNFNEAYQKECSEQYGHEEPGRNFYHFMFEYISPNIIFPENKLTVQGMLKAKNESLIIILKKNPGLKEAFSFDEKMILSNLGQEIILDGENVIDFKVKLRKHPRVVIRNVDAYIFLTSVEKVFKVNIIEVSKMGFSVNSKDKIEGIDLGLEVVLFFGIKAETFSVRAKNKWINSKSQYGFIIHDKNISRWLDFIKLAYEELDIESDWEKEDQIAEEINQKKIKKAS